MGQNTCRKREEKRANKGQRTGLKQAENGLRTGISSQGIRRKRADNGARSGGEMALRGQRAGKERDMRGKDEKRTSKKQAEGVQESGK